MLMDTVCTAGGRVIGRKGRATRERLLEGLERLLAARPLSELAVLDVAATAGVSPATFYQYFRTLHVAVVALEADAGFAARVHGYRPRGGTVRAVRWDGGNAGAVRALVGDRFRLLSPDERASCQDPEATAVLEEPGRTRTLRTGWWIVRGEKGVVQMLPDREFRCVYGIAGADGSAEGP